MLHSINISFAEDNMTTDYSTIEWKANPGFKGGEGTFYNKMLKALFTTRCLPTASIR